MSSTTNFLTSYERQLLANFITASKEQQEQTLKGIINDPTVPGPLFRAFLAVSQMI